MIFDNVTITEKVISWQQDQNPDTLAEIIEGSQGLVEALVSGFDPSFRDDLIQESYMKVVYVLNLYNPDIATLHTYLTTVIKNACLSWLAKYDQVFVDIDMIDLSGGQPYSKDDLDCILQELITNNRIRYPSIDTEDLDSMTELIFGYLNDGSSKHKIIRMLVEVMDMNRPLVASIVASSIIYLRSHYGYSTTKPSASRLEFTLLPELKEIVGQRKYDQILTLFSGFTIKIP